MLFVSGPVSIERATATAARAGDVIEQGDIIATGAKARAQLLMNDGARIALRSGSRFRIDEFSLPAAVTAPVKATTANASGKAVSSLLKGGFRTTTGAIGKTDPAAYAVRTPVGTLGIRGTRYVAVWCMGDCTDAPGLQPGDVIRDGLYLAVEEGDVVFQYGEREIRLTAGQVIFIPASGGEPETLESAPDWLRQDGAGDFKLAGRPAGGKAADARLPGVNERRTPAGQEQFPEPEDVPPGADDSGGVDQQIQGTDPNGGTIDLTPGGGRTSERRDIAWSVASLATAPDGYAAVEDVLASGYALDGNGNPIRFDGGLPAGPGLPLLPATFDRGAASVVNASGSATAVLRWGRWSGGDMLVTTGSGTAGVNLDLQSLHWILSGNADDRPAIPISGNVTYTLVGGTNPTDGAGNTGTLGSATLVADFTAIELTTTLDLNIAGNAWSASGTGAIGNQASLPANHFSGSYDTIQINLIPSAATGQFLGFFSGPATGPGGAPAGAGLTFNLIDVQTGLQVNGAAAFVAP
jgi:hypothetical protein